MLIYLVGAAFVYALTTAIGAGYGARAYAELRPANVDIF